jgi:cyanophycinase
MKKYPLFHATWPEPFDMPAPQDRQLPERGRQRPAAGPRYLLKFAIEDGAMGTIALVGGNEFRTDCVPMDEDLLRRSELAAPLVVIIPTAAARENPRLAAENGVRYFSALGAKAHAALLLDREDAGDTRIVNLIGTADIVYLTGGDPGYLAAALRGTAAWQAILQVWQRGGTVAGSSAGAMVLGERMLFRSAWTDTLNLAPRVVVMPHHRGLASPTPPPWAAELGQLVVLGIPEATACVSEDGRTWHVTGAATVHVYTAEARRAYAPGESFTRP